MFYSNEQGRSMIEMLGVLAIVGILSVGGIAGYSKAMTKFKQNQLIEQLNETVTNIRGAYLDARTYKGLTTGLAKKIGLMPKEMYSDISSGNGTNVFGGEVIILTSSGNGTDADDLAFEIHLTGIPSNVCETLLTQDWGTDPASGFVGIKVQNTDDTSITDAQMSSVVVGTTDIEERIYTIGQQADALPATYQIAIPACTCASKGCTVGFKFK